MDNKTTKTKETKSKITRFRHCARCEEIVQIEEKEKLCKPCAEMENNFIVVKDFSKKECNEKKIDYIKDLWNTGDRYALDLVSEFREIFFLNPMYLVRVR